VIRSVLSDCLDDLLPHGSVPVVAAALPGLHDESEVMHDRSQIVAAPLVREARDELCTRAAPLRHDGVPQFVRLQRHDLLAGVKVLPASLRSSRAQGRQHLVPVRGSSSSSIRWGQIATSALESTRRGRSRHRQIAQQQQQQSQQPHARLSPHRRVSAQERERTEPRGRERKHPGLYCCRAAELRCADGRVHHRSQQLPQPDEPRQRIARISRKSIALHVAATGRADRTTGQRIDQAESN
jgi:hypothetical protein